MFSKEYFEHYKKTFLLAYPVSLSQLGHIMVGVVDIAMVGQISTEAQAAVSLASNIFILVLVFGIGISYGMTPMVAAADSENNHSQNSLLLKNGLFVNVLTGLVLFVFLFFVSPVLGYFDQPGDVVKLAIPFLNVLMLSMIPLCIFQTFKQFAEGLSLTKIAMVISVFSNLLNIALNYILIFGKFGFQPMGIMGSCWATFIARMVMAFAMFGYVYFGKRFQIYWKGVDFKTLSAPIIKKILSIGIPSGMQFVFEVGAFSFAAVMIGWLGAKEMAAHQIALSMAAITYMIASGISAAATVRVGNQFGLKDIQKLRAAGFSAFFMAIGFMLLSATTFVSFSNVLPTFFNKEQDVINITSSLIIIAAFFQLSDGIQVVGLGVLRGIKDVKIPTIITLFAYWIIGLPCSYLLAFKFELGVKGVWYGLLIGLSIAAILSFLRFNTISKKIIKQDI